MNIKNMTLFQNTKNFQNENTSRKIIFNACFDKTQIKNLVSWYLSEFGERKTIEFLEKLKQIGFHQATKAGISLGIEDLQIPPEKSILITETQIENFKINEYNSCGSLTSVEKSTYLIEIWNQTSDKLRQTAIQNFKVKNPVNPVYMMAFSGARGNVSQVRQLIAMRGLMADPQGAILEFPIQSNFREGLTITEYLISCYGARKGLVDTALRTATSGYLTRRLVDSAQHAIISLLDCKTTKSRTLENEDLEQRLIGRVLAQQISINKNTIKKNTQIDQRLANLISNNFSKVEVRSPLTCAATTVICQLCYGWNLASGKLVQLGDAVGVIAAQSIGEPGTQLTMRTFHTGGVGVFSDQALKPIFSSYTGIINFLEPLPGHFVRTPNGKIVYMLKYIPSDQNKILLELITCQGVKIFQITENQLPPGSILFVKNGEYILPKTLIAQANYIKVTKQQLPESSHPVYASQTGQIFYEAMNLVIEKEKIANQEFNLSTTVENKNFLELVQSSLNVSENRRLSTIGSFWILSTSTQQDLHTTRCFPIPGDLISKNTFISNYLFFSKYQSQLKLINKQLAFGSTIFELPLEKTFMKNNLLVLLTKKYKLGVFIQNKFSNSKSTVSWYFLKKNFFKGFLKPSFINKFLIKNWNIKNKYKLPQGFVLQSSGFDIKKTKTHTNSKYLIKNQNIFIRNKTYQSVENTVRLKSKENHFQEKNITQNQIWPLYIQNSTSHFYNNQIIAPGIEFLKLSIPKCYCRINTNFYLIKQGSRYTNLKRNWYSNFEFISVQNFKNLFDIKSNLTENVSQFEKFNLKNSSSIIWCNKNIIIRIGKKQQLELNKLIYIEKYVEKSFLTSKNFKEKLHSLYSLESEFINVKQQKTEFNITKYPPILLTHFIKSKSGLFKSSELFKIVFKFSNPINNLYTKNYTNFVLFNSKYTRGLQIFNFYLSEIQKNNNLKFQTFPNNFITTNIPFSNGAIQARDSGEFLVRKEKSASSAISILTNTNLVKIPIQNYTTFLPNIGDLIRWGDEVEQNFGCPYNGQVIKKTKNFVLLRTGNPILASARGIIHVNHGDLINQNDLVITLKSRRLQTEDIVQGIPKIEQLFEARESQSGEILADTVHLRLRSAFVQELESLTEEHWSIAVEKSFVEAQNFLVENIQTAYSNQGVKISEKHIEVIVRQMTSRVRILEAGETGLLPGELVQHNWMKKFNEKICAIGLREATYEPIVLGISKSVLQSESFLLAASFQEVSRVLIKSSLSKKRDFLQGLHENVIVGQAIPAGTGLITKNLFLSS